MICISKALKFVSLHFVSVSALFDNLPSLIKLSYSYVSILINGLKHDC